MNKNDKGTQKNTLKTPQSTIPFEKRIPFKKPNFANNIPKFTQSFRTQNRGGK